MKRNPLRLFVLLCLVALTAGLGVARAARDAGVERIIFTSSRDGNAEVYSMNPDGSDVVRLTNNPAADYSPALSADGRRIAFVSDRDGNNELYVMNADGTDQTRLTDNPNPDTAPDWSPDGKRIVFVSQREVSMELFIMDADGSNVTNFTQHAEADFNMAPAWSPDGARIAFGSRRLLPADFADQIFVQTVGQPVDENNPVVLTESGDWSGYPDWSPDGARLVYVRFENFEQEIAVVNADGSNTTPLTDDDFTDYTPAWSPDGTRIVFASLRDGTTRRGLYVMNGDGSAITRLSPPDSGGSEPSWGVIPAERATLTVVQTGSTPTPGAPWSFIGPWGRFSLPAAGGSRAISFLAPGVHTVSQNNWPDYTPAVTCSNGVTGSHTVTLTLAAGDNVTCTFSNTYHPLPEKLYLPAAVR